MITAINDSWPQRKTYGRNVWLGRETGHNKGRNTFHEVNVSEPLVRRSPSNVAMPSSPMSVSSPASL